MPFADIAGRLANSAAILTDAFPADQRGFALGTSQVAAIAGQFIGLVAGGILAALDWRAVFWVNVPVGVFGTLWAYRMLRDNGERRARRPVTRPARGSRFRRDPDTGHHPAGTLPVMQTLVVDHPLVTHKLTVLRDSSTEAPTFRRLTDELVTLLAYEATREVPVRPVTVRTPVGDATGAKMARPVPLVVPVLRAGIGMLDGMVRLLPTAEVGFVGLARDEESLVASTYANRLPAGLSGRAVFVLDPMLATGGTLETVFRMLIDRGASAVTGVSLLAAPEGIARLETAFPGDGPVPVRVVTAALDERLNDRGFIVPGLGDAGDRLFGEI